MGYDTSLRRALLLAVSRAGCRFHRPPRCRGRFDAGWIRQTKSPVWLIDQVRPHVAECTNAEVGPASPVEWMIDRVILNRFRNPAQIDVPVKTFRYRI